MVLNYLHDLALPLNLLHLDLHLGIDLLLGFAFALLEPLNMQLLDQLHSDRGGRFFVDGAENGAELAAVEFSLWEKVRRRCVLRERESGEPLGYSAC